MAFVKICEVLPTAFSPPVANQDNLATVLKAAHEFRLEGLDINPAALERFVYVDEIASIPEIINIMKPRDYDATPLQIGRITARLHIAVMKQIIKDGK